jgi:hypothetical protein
VTVSAQFTRSDQIADDLDIDDATVVLIPGTVLVLRGLDRGLYRLLDDSPRTGPQLAASLADLHDAECTPALVSDTAQQLDWLAAQGAARALASPPPAPARPAPTLPARRADDPAATVVSLDVMGVRIDVRFDPRDDAAGTFAHAWNRCVVAAAEPGQVSIDAPRHGSPYALTSTVTHAAILQLRGSRLMLHATAVQIGEESVAVFVGASGSGKTTLAHTLGRRFGYVTDETVSIDPHDFTVAPFPKPLCIVNAGAPSKSVEPPDALGLLPLTRTRGLRITHLLFMDRRPEHHQEPRIDTDVHETDLFALVAPHISALSALPDPLATVQRLLRTTPTVGMLRYAEADAVTALFTDPARGPV